MAAAFNASATESYSAFNDLALAALTASEMRSAANRGLMVKRMSRVEPCVLEDESLMRLCVRIGTAWYQQLWRIENYRVSNRVCVRGSSIFVQGDLCIQGYVPPHRPSSRKVNRFGGICAAKGHCILCFNACKRSAHHARVVKYAFDRACWSTVGQVAAPTLLTFAFTVTGFDVRTKILVGLVLARLPAAWRAV